MNHQAAKGTVRMEPHFYFMHMLGYGNFPEVKKMLGHICLTDLKRGQKGVISCLTACDDMRRRLQDMGLIEGTVVECVGKSPLGDPTAFLIRGAVIALRNEDSGRVLIQDNGQESYDPIYGEGIAAACVTAEEEIWD
nr:FeoA family protein [Lacrimispora amygdalina]